MLFLVGELVILNNSVNISGVIFIFSRIPSGRQLCISKLRASVYSLTQCSVVTFLITLTISRVDGKGNIVTLFVQNRRSGSATSILCSCSASVPSVTRPQANIQMPRQSRFCSFTKRINNNNNNNHKKIYTTMKRLSRLPELKKYWDLVLSFFAGSWKLNLKACDISLVMKFATWTFQKPSWLMLCMFCTGLTKLASVV